MDLISQVEAYLAEVAGHIDQTALPDGRAFTSELWSEYGFTMFTCRFPKTGLEHLDALAVMAYLKSQGVPTEPSAFAADQIQFLTDINDPSLFNLTLVLAEAE